MPGGLGRRARERARRPRPRPEGTVASDMSSPVSIRSLIVRSWLVVLALSSLATAFAQACEPRLLGRSQAAEVHETHRDLIDEPGRYQRRLPSVAAGFFSEVLCAAVQRIVFIEDAGEPSGTMGWVRVASHNDLVHVDGRENHADDTDLDPDSGERPEVVANVWAAAIDTIVHEGGHAATHLLHTQIVPGDCRFAGVLCDAPTDASQWDAPSLAVARAAAERARLGGGFRAEWARMHEAFARAGLAAPYAAAGMAPDSRADDVARGGVMTPYGATSPSEDIAEAIAKALVDPTAVRIAGVAPTAARTDLGCQALQGADAVQSWNAALVAKLGFLADVGLIDERALERCTGGLAVDTRGADGFHTFRVDDGAFQQSYTDGVEATLGVRESGDRIVFTFEASGTASFRDVESPVRLRLVIDLAPSDVDIRRVSWPRGLYWLGEGVTAFTLRFENEEIDGASFIATGGPILITRASDERIEGSLVIQRGLRLSPAVPLVADELRRVTFRIGGGD